MSGYPSERLRLGDILRLRKEVVHPFDKPTGRLKFVGLEHLESGTGQRVGELDVDLAILTGRKPRFYQHDIVYGYLRPYLNKVWLAEFDGICSVDQYVYSVDTSRAIPAFVAWFMRSPAYLSQAPVKAGPGQLPRIRTDEVADVVVNLPPTSVQKEIVRAIEEQLTMIQQARAAAEVQHDATRQLLRSELRAAFSSKVIRDWPSRQLGHVSDIMSGVTLGRPLTRRATRNVPYLRVANVKDGFLDLSDVYDTPATDDEIQKLRLRPGDLLLTEGGDADKLGRGTCWRDEISECIHQNHIFRVRLQEGDLLPDFVSAQISSGYGKAYFLAHAKQTTGIATINRKVLAGFPLLVPPLSVQRDVAERVGRCSLQSERLRNLIQQTMAHLDVLGAALLRRTFAGELWAIH
jgi:type I restriction enzyme, S subunit